MNTIYKQSSVVLAGFACLLIASEIILRPFLQGMTIEEELAIWRNIYPLKSMATPVLFCWIGILLRGRYPSPKGWVKGLLLAFIPASYLLWTILHRNGISFYGDGERCIWLYSAILGFIIPAERLKGFSKENGWLELALFLASAFCYCGVTRVEDHFGVENYQMLSNELTRLFCRMMRFAPLGMSLFFLSEFSFSRIGQKIGSVKAIGWTVQVLAGLSFLLVFVWSFPRVMYFFELYRFYKLVSQPVTVYLLVVLVRLARGKARRSGPLKGDIFQSIQ